MRTAVFLKAFYLLALTALLLFGQHIAIELQVFAAILAVGFLALDFFCIYKRTVYAVNAERLKASPETFVFDDCVKPFKESEKWGKSAVCSAVWYALLFIAVVILREFFGRPETNGALVLFVRLSGRKIPYSLDKRRRFVIAL